MILMNPKQIHHSGLIVFDDPTDKENAWLWHFLQGYLYPLLDGRHNRVLQFKSAHQMGMQILSNGQADPWYHLESRRGKYCTCISIKIILEQQTFRNLCAMEGSQGVSTNVIMMLHVNVAPTFQHSTRIWWLDEWYLHSRLPHPIETIKVSPSYVQKTDTLK
jgi:hypothetical protein